MKIALYSIKRYEQDFFESIQHTFQHELIFIEQHLKKDSLPLSRGCKAVSCFVTDQLDDQILKQLKKEGVQFITLRSAGFDHINLKTATDLGLSVAHVPGYSPHAIAEFSVGLLLALSRKLLRAHDRIRNYNFSLDGQLGFNIQGKTVGLIGIGKIGAIAAKILSGFDCKLIAYDPKPNDICKAIPLSYVSLPTLLKQSDIISLHCALNSNTHHIINQDALELMKEKVIIINTGRGRLIDTTAIIKALKKGKIGGLGLDVYEHEKGLFFQDLSDTGILDDQFVRLQSFPNVLITGHQAYFSFEAMNSIAQTTLENVTAFELGKPKNCLN